MSNRDIAATWRYHLATNHSPERLRATPHFLDPATKPLPYKIYTPLPPLPLPDAPASFTMPALDAIAATDEAPADERRVLGPGGTWRILGGTPHSVQTGPGGAVVVDVFAPARDDWDDRPTVGTPDEPAALVWPRER